MDNDSNGPTVTVPNEPLPENVKLSEVLNSRNTDGNTSMHDVFDRS